LFTVGVIWERPATTDMLPLYEEPHFTFRFDDDRIIPASSWRASRPGGGSPSSYSIP
jgi:hypothetical protein